MIARTRLKLRNAEKSISFMQEQHAKTLAGLHQEIDKLQKKNARKFYYILYNHGIITTSYLLESITTGLTFQLIMNGGASGTGNISTE